MGGVACCWQDWSARRSTNFRSVPIRETLSRVVVPFLASLLSGRCQHIPEIHCEDPFSSEGHINLAAVPEKHY